MGPRWICDIISVVGDKPGPNGELLTEELELWRRDPVDCTRDLIGNPAFGDYMAYGPIKITRDGVRYYGESNSADWWWEIQVSHVGICHTEAFNLRALGQAPTRHGRCTADHRFRQDHSHYPPR